MSTATGKFIRFGPTLNAKRHELIPANSNIYDLIKRNPNKDYYTSLYRYSAQHLEYFKKEGSVAGIRDVTTNRIVFDFDSKVDVGLAQKDAIVACERLMELGVPEDKLRIFFSGNKGLHIEVTSRQEFTRQEFENIVNNVAGDLPTFDTRIKDEARVLRAPLTKHPVSGLYKIPLVFEELKKSKIKEIQSWATEADFDPDQLRDELFEIDLPPKVIALKDKSTDKAAPEVKGPILGFDVQDIDFSKCPRWMARERYALQEGFFYGSESVDKGERNTAFMILAATYKAQGFSDDHTLMLLSVAADKQSRRTGEDLVSEDQLKREVVNPVYSPSWKGGIYGKHEELLVITRKRFNIDEPTDAVDENMVDISSVGNEFKTFAKNIDQNRIRIGLDSLDNEIIITSGMLVSLLAAPGAGKTSLANLFVENLNKSGEHTIYFSLDMYKNLLFNRLLQRFSGLDIKKILQMYKDEAPDERLLDAYSQVVENYSNVAFNFRSGLTIDEIEEAVKRHCDKIGKSVKLVVVDYLEKIRTQFTDHTASTSYAAGRLSDIAKKYDTAVLLLVQPSKVGGGDPRDEFKNYRAIKGSSSIESESRIILGLHRPGYNPVDSSEDNYASLSVLKNNSGPLVRLDYAWNGVAGQFSELDSYGRGQLKVLRRRLEEEKAAKANKYDL